MLQRNSRRIPLRSALVISTLTSLLLAGCVGPESEPGNSTDAGTDTHSPDTQSADAGYDDAMSDNSDGMSNDSSDGVSEPTSALSLTVNALSGTSIESATVRVGDIEKTTGRSGEANFESLDPGRTVAQIEASGFAPSTTVVDLSEETTTHRTAHLLRIGSSQTFDPTTPSDLYDDRVHVQLPADALVDADGNTYSGTAEVQITPLNPSTSEGNAMPGPLMGVLEGDDEPTPMESVFMADIQFSGDSGEPLSLKDGKRATLEFVLPDDLQDQYSKGDDIEAYWYDPDAGLWQQEGVGEVVESTYAAGKLAWTAEVSHFTWWNADKPVSDKNCAEIEVVRKGTGNPVSGANVYVKGVGYNYKSFGITGKNGKTCADFKKGSKIEITAAGPKGLRQSGFGVRTTGSNTAAACSGQGNGSCQQVTVELEKPTCVSGKVVDSNGNPIKGADVVGTYRGANGRESVRAITGSSGEYCLSVPKDLKVDVTVQYKDNGTLQTASTSIRANSKAKSCGSGSCKSVPTLTPKKGETACLSTSIVVDDPSGMRSASAGTHVYAFAGTGDYENDIDVDCSKKPEEWGTLLDESTTGSAGDSCLNVPKNAQELIVAVGKCNSGQECVVHRQVGTQISNSSSCGAGNCTQIERIGLPVCADGP